MANHPNADKAVVYGRVSIALKVTDSTSLANQLETGVGWAANKRLAVLESLGDDGVSGKDYWTRPGIQKALTLIEQKKAKYLICETVDRSARATKISHDILDRVIKADGILVANGYEFDGSPNTKLMASIFFGLAEWDYDNTRRKLLTGRRNAALGLKPSAPWKQVIQRGNPPYALYVPTDLDVQTGKFPQVLLGRHVIVKGDRAQARLLSIVQSIFLLYHQGHQLTDISKWLKKEGIVSPGGCPNWPPKTVSYILKNHVYQGAGKIFKSTSRRDEMRAIDRGLRAHYDIPTDPDTWEDLLPVVLYDPETGEIVDAPPTIDPDIFVTVTERRAKEAQEKQGGGELHYYLSHFGRCSVCGGRWSAIHQESKYGAWTYYRCAGKYIGKSGGAKNKGCSAKIYPYMPTKTVETALVGVLETLANDPSIVEQAINAYEDKLYGNDDAQRELDRLVHEQTVARKQMDKAQRQMLATDDAEEETSWQRIIDDMKESLLGLKPRIAALERQTMPRDVTSPRTRSERLSEAVADARLALLDTTGEITAEEKARVLSLIVEGVAVDDEGRLVVAFKSLSHIPDLGIKIVGAKVREGDSRRKHSDEEAAAILAEGAQQSSLKAWLKERGISSSTYYRLQRAAKARLEEAKAKSASEADASEDGGESGGGGVPDIRPTQNDIRFLMGSNF